MKPEPKSEPKRKPFLSLGFWPINTRTGMAQVELLEGDDAQLYISIKTERGRSIFVKPELAAEIVLAVNKALTAASTTEDRKHAETGVPSLQ